MNRSFYCLIACITAALAACYVGPLAEEGGAGARPGSDVGTDASTATDGGASVGQTGLPCDVEAVLKRNQCLNCHGASLSLGAPMPLLGHGDLKAPAKSDASKTVAELMVLRMRDASKPMPPSGIAPAADTKIVESWIAAGYPKGSCGQSPMGDAAAPPPIVSQCSSGTYWTGGNEKSPFMNPGRACITCHSAENAERNRERAPGLVGGTVYPTVREPNLCNGVAGNASIVITDANNQSFTLPVNRVGNFFASTTNASGMRFPIRAKVVANGKERAMSTPQMTADCNSCHTENGLNGAPGRIYLP
jgi:hypothetical protein